MIHEGDRVLVFWPERMYGTVLKQLQDACEVELDDSIYITEDGEKINELEVYWYTIDEVIKVTELEEEVDKVDNNER